MAYEIEKKSLEAHVEICAERYTNLEQRMVNENHIVRQEVVVRAIKVRVEIDH